MADFRTKILGLTAVALAFTGVASAQSNCNAGVAGVVSPYALSVPSLRAEGATELVGDITFTCPASLAAVSQLSVTINGTTAITSKITTASSSTSEIALVIAGAGGSTTHGTVSGSTVTFSNFTPPAGGFTATIENIRVNATALPTGSVPVTANVIANSGSISLVSTNITVGFVATSLKAPSLTAAKSTSTANPRNLVACVGNSASTGVGGFSFAFDITEAITGAFKTQTQETGPDAATASTANSGTRFTITVSGIPSGATAYLPLEIAHSSGLTLDAIVSPTAATAAGNLMTATTPASSVPTVAGTTFPTGIIPAGGPPITSGENLNNGVFALSPTGGVATAYYEVTASVPTALELASVPVWLISSAGKVTAPGTVSVTLGYSQTGAIPNFAASTLAALNGSVVGLCNTTLLFPYITTAANYETGIAISNTSTDPFGTSGATASVGTCALNFYGTTGATAVVANTTVAVGPNGATTGTAGSIPSGQTAAFIASPLTGAGFSGYMIASCSFQYGHGFAYILGNPAVPANSTAMGYLALVIQDPAEVGGGRTNALAVSESLGN